MLKKDLEQELNRTKLVLDYAREELQQEKEETERLNNIIKGLDNTIENLNEVVKHKDNIINNAIEYLTDEGVCILNKGMKENERLVWTWENYYDLLNILKGSDKE